MALLAVLEVHVHRLPEHVVEDLEDLLGDERIVVRRGERVLSRLPRQGERQRAPLPRRPRAPAPPPRPRPGNAKPITMSSGRSNDRQTRLEVRAQVQRRQRPLADDHRVHELHRDVLGVGGGGPSTEGEEPPACQKAARHLVAGLG